MATGTLYFYRWTSYVPESWTCTVTVGMPLRAEAYGVITPQQAGTITAGVATTSSFAVTNKTPNLPPGVFCSAFKAEMGTEFAAIKGLGAKMM